MDSREDTRAFVARMESFPHNAHLREYTKQVGEMARLPLLPLCSTVTFGQAYRILLSQGFAESNRAHGIVSRYLPCRNLRRRRHAALDRFGAKRLNLSFYMKKTRLHPVPPGEILLEEFLKPMTLSQNRLALALGVPPRRINEIVLGKRLITADTALRLARYFGNSAQFWMGLQMDFDLDVARQSIGRQIEQEVRLRA